MRKPNQVNQVKLRPNFGLEVREFDGMGGTSIRGLTSYRLSHPKKLRAQQGQFLNSLSSVNFLISLVPIALNSQSKIHNPQ